MEFSIENPDRPRTRELRSSSQTAIGNFESLVPAHDGGLWISGTRGLAKIPGPVRSLRPETPWTEHVVPDELGVCNLRGPTQAKDGVVTMTGDLLKEKDNLKAVVHFDGSNWAVEKIGTERIRLAWRGPDGATWAAKVDGLYRREYGEPELAEYEELTARQYFDLAVEPTGAFWLASSEGLFRFAEPAWTAPMALRAQNSPVHCLAADGENRLWFCTSAGLSLFADEKHSFFPFPPEHARDFQMPRGVYPTRKRSRCRGPGAFCGSTCEPGLLHLWRTHLLTSVTRSWVCFLHKSCWLKSSKPRSRPHPRGWSYLIPAAWKIMSTRRRGWVAAG
jgi:hypothetical protein